MRSNQDLEHIPCVLDYLLTLVNWPGQPCSQNPQKYSLPFLFLGQVPGNHTNSVPHLPMRLPYFLSFAQHPLNRWFSILAMCQNHRVEFAKYRCPYAQTQTWQLGCSPQIQNHYIPRDISIVTTPPPGNFETSRIKIYNLNFWLLNPSLFQSKITFPRACL